MKTTIIFPTVLILIMLSIFSIVNCQEVNKPPYPIIFIHGWAGNEGTWTHDEGNWQTYFEGFGWQYGGRIDICLEMNTQTLHDEAYSDVECLSENLPSNGDFFMINFDVNRVDTIHPNVVFYFQDIQEEDQIITMKPEEIANPYHINVDDILAITSTPLLSLGKTEYVRVLAADYLNKSFQVERGLFDSPKTDGEVNFVKNHENLSSQASAFKQGIAVRMAIEKVKQATGADKVVLVCHSMGGLAARAYVQSSNYNNDVSKVITISSPHMGSDLSDVGFVLDFPIMGMDIQSDAVRDLRYHLNGILTSPPEPPPYPNDIDNALYLFGGSEDTQWGDFIISNFIQMTLTVMELKMGIIV